MLSSMSTVGPLSPLSPHNLPINRWRPQQHTTHPTLTHTALFRLLLSFVSAISPCPPLPAPFSLAMTFFFALLFPVLSLLLCLSPISADPSTEKGLAISNAVGVALSVDGTTAFVSTLGTFPAVYAIHLPINSSANFKPLPYFTNPFPAVYYYIAASTSRTSLPLIYMLDNQNAQLVSLLYSPTSPPPTRTTLVFNFTLANAYNVDGMYLQQSTGLMYLSIFGYYGGATNDFVGVIDPTAVTPTLSTFYTTSFRGQLAALAVSSSHLYFSVFTAVVQGTSNLGAQIFSVPLTSVGSVTPSISTGAPAELIYTTADANLATATVGDLIFPGAFQLNQAETILYLTDIGNQNAQPSSTPHCVYAVWPLTSTNVSQLNLTTIYSYYSYPGVDTIVQESFGLSADGGTLYFAAIGKEQGLYVTSNVNDDFL